MYCRAHSRYHCNTCGWNGSGYTAQQSNAGRLEIMSDGDLGIGLGNGLVLDINDGSIGVEIAPGFAVDL